MSGRGKGRAPSWKPIAPERFFEFIAEVDPLWKLVKVALGELEAPFVISSDGRVDLAEMARRLPASEWARYVELCRKDRARLKGRG